MARPPKPEWERMDVRLARTFRARQLPPVLLASGPAGTGKTFGILLFLHRLSLCNPGLRILIGRETRAALTESVLVTYEQEVLPTSGHEWMASGVQRRVRQLYRYPNGTEWVLAGLDNPGKALSTAWDAAFINEATGTSEASVETLASRLARPGRDIRLGLLLLDCNPADPLHWLKVAADAGRIAHWPTTHEANPAMFDGREWTVEGKRYLDRLDRYLTGTQYQRLRLGLWAAGEGAWFAAYDDSKDVSKEAAYHPDRGKVHLAIDCNGKHIGAVWFQLRDVDTDPKVCIFGDYYDADPAKHAAIHAKAILDKSQNLCGNRVDRLTGDPSGGQHTGVNTTVDAEYRKAGLPLNHWPKHGGSVARGLSLIESFLGGNLQVHPSCRMLRTALLNFKRKRRNNQWIDEPEDPQHPHEDLIEALRGGLLDKWPNGRRPDLKLRKARVTHLG